MKIFGRSLDGQANPLKEIAVESDFSGDLYILHQNGNVIVLRRNILELVHQDIGKVLKRRKPQKGA